MSFKGRAEQLASVARKTRRGFSKNRRRPATLWVVIAAAMAQALLQAGDSVLVGQPHSGAWWAAGALALAFLAFLTERYKPHPGGIWH